MYFTSTQLARAKEDGAALVFVGAAPDAGTQENCPHACRRAHNFYDPHVHQYVNPQWI